MIHAGVDFIARLAEAWNYDGRHPFKAAGTEHRALLALASLPAELERQKWDQLTGEQRHRLIMACRYGVTFGRQCAWVFGEGRGA